MNTIHLDLQGKTARVIFQSLLPARPKPDIRYSTETGAVASVRVLNGINPAIDPFKITAQDLMKDDPEVVPAQAGEVVDVELLTAAYYDATGDNLAPATDFKQIDVVYDATGAEKERRPHVSRKNNVNDLHPVKIGKRMPLEEALTSFVFKHIYQIVHEDGVQRDFLFDLANSLHDKKEMAVLGSGAKGNQPLIVRDKGSPYRAFLYGETGSGEDAGKYKLLLMLTDQELKRPATSTV